MKKKVTNTYHGHKCFVNFWLFVVSLKSLGLIQRDRQQFTAIFTPMGILESLFNLTPVNACIWTVGES